MGRIMFIDDDPMVLRMAGFMMKKSGNQILTADSGKLGIAAAREQDPDLIFVDADCKALGGAGIVVVAG